MVPNFSGDNTEPEFSAENTQPQLEASYKHKTSDMLGLPEQEPQLMNSSGIREVLEQRLSTYLRVNASPSVIDTLDLSQTGEQNEADSKLRSLADVRAEYATF